MHFTHRSLLVVLASLLVAACSADDGKPGGSSAPTPPVEPTDAGADAEIDGAAVAKKKNAEPCTTAAECESNLCFVGTNQSYCAVKCTAADAPTTCVAPFTGSCNKQGYCKRD